MAAEFKLSYTANEINEKLGKVGEPISWNDLTDKPFGEETTTVGGDTLTWDGNTEGLVNVMGAFYKISDKIVTIDDCKEGVTVDSNIPTMAHHYTYDNMLQYVDGEGFLRTEEVFFIPSDNFSVETMGVTFPEAGIYIPWMTNPDTGEGAGVTSITIPGYTGFVTEQTIIKTIDPKYLPETSSSGISDEEVLELLMEMDIVQPIANQNGVLYINNNNKLYVL